MSDDFGAKGFLSAQSAPSKEDLITIAQTAINSSHNGVRRDADGAPILDASVQQPGATVDLCHKQIANLPQEVVEIIKDEIERLAISHNGLSTFPPSLAECRRLRYLNGRYNRLKEIPQSVLLLPSLEILDLSRNRIRTLPDSIRHMSSLKVLALQRNHIERLPTCLGEMSTLRVLKINENPLVFPPKEIYASDDDTAGAAMSGDKAMIAVTQKIKRYLRDHAGVTPRARLTFSESDSDVSESNAETPRPYRPMGTRFPVRPSLGGADGIGIPSTSPDPPPVPSKSHERIRSNQIPPSRKQTLLSPPESTVPSAASTFGEAGSDVTVRPKRHGMITPRGPDGAAQQMALSPSALQDAFGNVGSRPPSRTESALSTSSISMESVMDTSKIIYNTAGDLYQRLYSLRPSLDTSSEIEVRSKFDVELQIALLRADALQKAVNKSPSGNTQHSHRHIVRPLVDCLASVSALSRLLIKVMPLYCRTRSHDSYRQTFWSTQRDIWEIHVANYRMSDVLASVTHTRQTSTSSQYLVPIKSRFDSAHAYSRSGNGPSPTVSSFSIATVTNGAGNTAVFSPIPAPLNVQSRSTEAGAEAPYTLREDELRQEKARDAEWETMCRILHNMCEVTVDNLSKVQANYRAERTKAMRQGDVDYELVKQLGSLVNRCNTIMEAANTLARRLEGLMPQNRAIRHSLEFWALPRTIILDWFGLARQFKSLPPSTYSPDMKNIMRPIHHAIKEVSRIVENSPWASYMQKSKHNGFAEAPTRQNLSNGANPAPIVIKPGQASNGSVPSTPLSAALGPAAAAAVPSKSAMGRPAINFFERADRFANATQRQPEVLYSRRAA